MSILSLTFHSEENSLADWENYLSKNLHSLTEKNSSIDKFILSDVETPMLQEGKNTNLLLFFKNANERNLFLEKEIPKIHLELQQYFGEKVLMFATLLNPKQ